MQLADKKMARHSIIEKLQRELEHPIESERQVVYLLVEVRKLIELGQDPGRFETVKFFCDWIAHPLLTGAMAQRIVRQFDKVHQHAHTIIAADDGQYVDTDWDFLRDFEEFVSLATFREQLTTYLQSQGLESTRITGEENWPSFLIYFARIIEDCPLRLRDDSLEHAHEVVVKVADVRSDDQARAVGYRVAIEWSSTSQKTGMELKQQRFY